MGYVKVREVIGNVDGLIVKEVEFLVDAGAFYTVIGPSLAKDLGIKPITSIRLRLADDDREVIAGLSLAYMKFLDRDGVFPVVIMESPEPLLGVVTFEGLGLRVDSTTGRLEYSRQYGLAVL
ncbi:aspartyl protease family protein [Vulcanisaeta moutnovskia]|nr:aspartyl protease family protein [Vulcanisaeta moutnovskia]